MGFSEANKFDEASNRIPPTSHILSLASRSVWKSTIQSLYLLNTCASVRNPFAAATIISSVSIQSLMIILIAPPFHLLFPRSPTHGYLTGRVIFGHAMCLPCVNSSPGRPSFVIIYYSILIQEGMQWKHGVVICMMLYICLLYNTNPVH